MKIYSIIFMPPLKHCWEVLDNMELVTEQKLVEFVKEMIEEERIDPDLFNDDEEGEYDIENMDTAMAIKILKDDGYTIQEYEI